MLLRSVLVAAIALASPALFADDELGDGLAECREIEKNKQRLACYDALAADRAAPAGATDAVAATALPAVAAAPADAAAATTVVSTTEAEAAASSTEPAPLSDEVAKSSVSDEIEDKPRYSARVERCVTETRPDVTYFYMENGQVWRQSNSGRLRLRDRSCQFDVVISQTTFGWIMDIPSEKMDVRVRRIR